MYIISMTVAELGICRLVYDQATNNTLSYQTHHTHVFWVPNSGMFAMFLICYKFVFSYHPHPLPEKKMNCNPPHPYTFTN